MCEQLLPHVLALADALRHPGDAGVELIELLNRAGRYLHYAEPGRRDLATAQIVLAHAERVLGAEHCATLVARNDLAASYLGPDTPTSFGRRADLGCASQ